MLMFLLHQSIPIASILFYGNALLMLASACMVVVLRQPVASILWLILTFFFGAVLWLMLHAEFLALVLLFVYVGAVMTLFVFVVMMLNANRVSAGGLRWYHQVMMAIVFAIFLGTVIYLLADPHWVWQTAVTQVTHSAVSNTMRLGLLLYTDYFIPFQLSGLLLLSGIVAAIVLTHDQNKEKGKQQIIAQQLSANKKNRLKIVNLKSEAPR
jgi:NADH-quinone oxidoreductase subunit J